MIFSIILANYCYYHVWNDARDLIIIKSDFNEQQSEYRNYIKRDMRQRVFHLHRH